jgi:hypothetical protein
MARVFLNAYHLVPDRSSTSEAARAGAKVFAASAAGMKSTSKPAGYCIARAVDCETLQVLGEY